MTDAPQGGDKAGELGVPRDLLDILVCPLGKAPLRVEAGGLVCTRCGAVFHVVDGIPNMLIDDAQLPEGVSNIKDLACYSEPDE